MDELRNRRVMFKSKGKVLPSLYHRHFLRIFVRHSLGPKFSIEARTLCDHVPSGNFIVFRRVRIPWSDLFENAEQELQTIHH
ncbi:hypothetical protein CEXT_705061 [Caerostris extrusa]|uniref:Uncharacterized protein n=1 Tax=Caerostris extrusa TaxID=172846 RepID=A0AAV4Y0N6_CAEEX|nr:hypothetical protein CEXT_705061 [Caerostris extrusa]